MAYRDCAYADSDRQWGHRCIGCGQRVAVRPVEAAGLGRYDCPGRHLYGGRSVVGRANCAEQHHDSAGGSSTRGNILVTAPVNPEAAGDISIRARGNITGIENVVDADGAITGQAGTPIGQFWWQWMQVTAKPTLLDGGKFVALDRTSIDFGAFDQGVMSVGGNVMINAGGNIADLGVSLPTTWYKDASGTPVTAGGGNLTVRAGGDILSGNYFVAKGTGAIAAGAHRLGRCRAAVVDIGPSSGVGLDLAGHSGRHHRRRCAARRGYRGRIQSFLSSDRKHQSSKSICAVRRRASLFI